MDLRQPLTLRPFHPAVDAPAPRRWIPGPTDLMTWARPDLRRPPDDAQPAAYAAEPGRRMLITAADRRQ
ncbi:hypothetical protein ACFWFZ_31990 [Streptomyces sp. NPDC060232]|uniref:hypothetical protein n=1 Tax=Streptomyces sp. NPDC060232 TaxID=3347079 RepID=UPI00364C1C1C